MKFASSIIVCAVGAMAGGGHGRGVGVSAGYVQPFIAQPYQSAYVSTGPQFYRTATVLPAVVGGGALPGPPGPPHHHKHGHGQQAAAFIVPQQQKFVQPLQRTIIQPVQRTIVQEQPMVQYVEEQPLMKYVAEEVEERVFREPISKTVTELPDEVTYKKKVVNQHFPMIHQQVRDHYTILDEQENNIIHHYYEPEERYLGTKKGEKYTTEVEHVDHPGERMVQSEKFVAEPYMKEMVVEETGYKTVYEEKPSMKTVISQRPSYETVEVESPFLQKYVPEGYDMRSFERAAPVRSIRTVTSAKPVQTGRRLKEVHHHFLH
jgi:hypothetical protein